MIINIIFLIILIAIAAVAFKFILDIGSTAVKIAAHFISGWILLTIANILPGINIPVNLLTLIVSGFGGVAGTVVLAIIYLLF